MQVNTRKGHLKAMSEAEIKLKLVLFEETLNALNQWKESKKKFEKYDHVIKIELGKFCALYMVIKNCGLEEEYQEWKSETERE